GRQPRQVRDDLPRLPGQAPGRLPPAAHRRRGQDRPGAREAVIRRAAAAVALVAPFAAGAPAAGAATVSTPDSCYSSRAPVDYVGTEFRPRAKYTVFMSDKQVDTGRVSQFGDLAGDFKAPVPSTRIAGERTYTLTVTDGVRRASTRFRS